MAMPRSNRVVVKKVIVEDTWGCSTIFTQDKSEEVMEQESVTTLIDDSAYTDSYSLSYFQASMFASILEDTITQIRILEECNNEFRVMKTMADMVHLRAKKYNVAQPAVRDELDGINPRELGKEQYKLDKLANDRKYLYESLMVAYLDLSLNRLYIALATSIAEIINRDKHRAFLEEDEARNRATRRDLARQLRQQRNHIKSVNYDTDLAIEELKSQVEDAAMQAEIRSRYVTNWQVARTEQHHQAIKDRESNPLHNIEYYKTRTDHEQRVHTEVELMINITINEKLEKVESWMNKYDKDMEKMDLKIQIMKNDHTNKHEYRMELEDTHAKHDKLMKNWQHFKDEREKARLYIEKMNDAAAVVQSWWRGLLVRMELGPYKPTKRPPPKPEKPKKKK